MAKKNICIVGWKVGDNSFGVTTSYLEYFSKYGQVHILTPTRMQQMRVFSCDLLVLPGGRDVDPRRYGQTPSYKTGFPDVYLEHFDKYMLPMYIERNIPIFGICRGLQTLAVHHKLPLVQDLLSTHDYSTKSRSELVHNLYKPTSYSNKGFPKNSEVLKVNSLHHQGVHWNTMLNNPDSGLKELLVSDDYYVEAFEHATKPISGVQWHPEEIEDDYSAAMIKKLLEWKKR